MERIKIDIDQSEAAKRTETPIFAAHQERAAPGRRGKVLKIFGSILGILLVVAAVSAFLAWNYYKDSPQYALAELVQAARTNDEQRIAELVDTDAVVEDFLPQITEKAIELYGRGMPAEKIRAVSKVVVPIMPAVKDRAKAELPGLIREKTQAFDRIPFWAIVIGAGRYLKIEQTGDSAVISSLSLERPVKLTMDRTDAKWRVVGVEDEALAQRVAERVGQEIIAIAGKDRPEEIREAGKNLGVDNVKDLLKQAESIFR